MAAGPVGVLFVLFGILSAGLAANAAQSALRAPKAQVQKASITKKTVTRPTGNKGTRALVTSKAVSNITKDPQSASPAILNSLSIGGAPLKKIIPSKFGILVSLTGSSNMYKQGSTDHEAFTELLLSPSYAFYEDVSLTLKSAVIHEEFKARNTVLSNSTVSLSMKAPKVLTQDLSISGRVIGVLPTNEEARKSDRLQGAAGLGAGAKWIWKKIGIGYSLVGTRNFHEFTVNADGSPNIRYGLSHGLSFEAELTPKWSLSIGGLYKQAWTYQDFSHQAYSFETDINYNLNKMWTLGAGFSNEGSALKPNGIGSNIKVYDENTSVLRANVTFVN